MQISTELITHKDANINIFFSDHKRDEREIAENRNQNKDKSDSKTGT